MNDFTTPSWVKNAVFYQIFPDRFASSESVVKPGNLEAWGVLPTQHGFKGGDLQGVLEHLDYLEDLGITAIYFTPVFQSACNHRYHTHDYYRVDPLLGGDAALRKLIEAAHARDIRIVLDGVFNHASRGFFQFNHILEVGEKSPYIDWFDIKGFPLNAYEGKPNYRCWVDLAALPEFNTRNPQVREFIFGVARYWLEQGIDGWRLDVPFCIDDDSFWQEFRQVVKATNPEAYIVGEVPWDAKRWLQGDQFDAVMNYLFTKACVGFFAGEKGDLELAQNMMGLGDVPVLDAAAFGERMEELMDLYPREAALAQLNLLDSHDMPRFLSMARGDKTALKLATLFQMTYPGAPCVYYGDEIGLEGGRDPDCRRAFPWDISQWDTDLWDTIHTCIRLRKAHPALRQDGFSTLLAEGGIIAYRRSINDDSPGDQEHQPDQDKIFIVVINAGFSSATIDIPTGEWFPETSTLCDMLSKVEVQVTRNATGNLALNGLHLPARSGLVLAG
jgi:cyclomaltodextrinase / maltogenic alpha-amylase / neopullulanase